MTHGGYAVGIDLGTSNTVALLRWPDGRSRPLLFDGQPILPSGVYLDEGGHVHAGRDAMRLAHADPARYEPNPKRRIDDGVLLLGDRELSVVEAMAAPLRAVARTVADAVGHLPSPVLTYPATWGAARRSILQDAAARAGWPPALLVPEPIAAARYFISSLGHPVPAGSVMAVFDLGGGTFDVALVGNDGTALAVVGAGGAADLGGLDIDAALVNHLGPVIAQQHPRLWAELQNPGDELGRRHRRAFWDDVRAAKEMLSRSPVAPVPVPGVNGSLHLTREELDRVAQPLIERAVAEFVATVHRSGLNPAELSGIFLVGGASRVPLVGRVLHARTGVAPTILEQPELPVAEGALVEATGGLVEATGGTPAQPAPVSGVPVSGGPGLPVSGIPASGGPGLPVSAVPGGDAAPATSAAWPVLQPPTARPAAGKRRRRAAVIAAAAVLVLLAGVGTALALRPSDPTTPPPLSIERVVTTDYLKPDGLRTVLFDDKYGFAVGELADGRLDVARFSLTDQSRVEHRQTPTGAAWSTVERHGDWLVVDSAAGADGNRTVAFFDRAASVVHTKSFSKDDLLIPYQGDPKVAAGVARFLWLSPSKGVLHAFAVYESGIVVEPGPGKRAPAGARVIHNDKASSYSAIVVDAQGYLWVVSDSGATKKSNRPVPVGLPPELMFSTGSAAIVADNKAGYQVTANSEPLVTGPADRQPKWLGGCNTTDQHYCIVDYRAGAAPGWELAGYRDQTQQFRTPVADVGTLEQVSGTDDRILLRLRDGDRVSTVLVDKDGKASTYPGHFVIDVDPRREKYQTPIAVLLMPTASRTAAPTPLTQVRFGSYKDTTASTIGLGTHTVRTAGCAVTADRVGCPTESDFQIWRLRT